MSSSEQRQRVRPTRPAGLAGRRRDWFEPPESPFKQEFFPLSVIPQRQQRPPQTQNSGIWAQCQNRKFKVKTDYAEVLAEPRIGGKLVTKKSCHGKFYASEVTMDGWLRLAGVPGSGWIMLNMVPGGAPIAEVDTESPGQGQVSLAVEEYPPQGLCCLEVAFKSGVPVMESIAKDAHTVELRKTIDKRKAGELVFAWTQNFDGWVKLWGEPGWMLTDHPQWGPLLKHQKKTSMDVWALCDVWIAARKARNGSLSTAEVRQLIDLESRVLLATREEFEDVSEEKRNEKLLGLGWVSRDDLFHSEQEIFQRVTVGVLKRIVAEDAQFKELLPNFEVSERKRPWRGPESSKVVLRDDKLVEMSRDLDGDCDGWEYRRTKNQQSDHRAFERIVPATMDGKRYHILPSTLSFDLTKQRLFGKLIAETDTIEPVIGQLPNSHHEALWYCGKTYLLSKISPLTDDVDLLDPESREIIGYCNCETEDVQLLNSPPEWKSLAVPAPEPGSPVHAPEVQQENAASNGISLADMD